MTLNQFGDLIFWNSQELEVNSFIVYILKAHVFIFVNKMDASEMQFIAKYREILLDRSHVSMGNAGCGIGLQGQEDSTVK